MASSLAVGNMSLRRLAFAGGKDSSIVGASGLLIASISSLDGLPVTSMTRSSWFKVEVPGKTGLPRRSSARMQPKLHMSTPLV